MKEYKGIANGCVTLDDNSVIIKSAFIKESCLFSDILSVELVEPIKLNNGYLTVRTHAHNSSPHQIFFRSKHKEEFAELYSILSNCISDQNKNVVNNNRDDTIINGVSVNMTEIIEVYTANNSKGIDKLIEDTGISRWKAVSILNNAFNTMPSEEKAQIKESVKHDRKTEAARKKEEQKTKSEEAKKIIREKPKSKKIRKAEIMATEYKNKCNVCGAVYCYTLGDLDRNTKLAKQAAWQSLGAVVSFFDDWAASATYSGNAANATNRVVDYSKCPNCNSSDIRVLTESEWIEEIQKPSVSPESKSPSSTADELLKLKQLVDSDIITQEEFNAMKRKLIEM